MEGLSEYLYSAQASYLCCSDWSAWRSPSCKGFFSLSLASSCSPSHPPRYARGWRATPANSRKFTRSWRKWRNASPILSACHRLSDGARKRSDLKNGELERQVRYGRVSHLGIGLEKCAHGL